MSHPVMWRKISLTDSRMEACVPGSGDDSWWNGGVVYEIYPRSFQDSDGDGIGDLRGIERRLDYLNGSPDSLGIDAIWLTPIYPSPLFDFGYDVADYTAIDPVFGTMEDFERLTAAAHDRNIKVIMDLVANHSSHTHPWFVESRENRTNPKRDWYFWRDPAPDGGPPNNWISVFGGPAWTFDERTGQYYLHTFLSEQPDLNWFNPEVREAIFDVVRFWIDRGVDGFRLDAVNSIAKDPALPNNPPSGHETRPGWTGYETLEHVYDKNQPVLHEWLADLREAADRQRPSILLISEIYGLDAGMISRLHGGGARPQVDVSFNFDLLEADWSAHSFRNAIENFLSSLPPAAVPNAVLNNHDNSRLVSRYDESGLGGERARVAAVLIATLPGIAFLYYGEEIGMRDGTLSREQLLDPVGIRFWPENQGRDPARTPMQWDRGQNAGFTTGAPWLPVNSDAGAVNVVAEATEPGSMLSLYRRILRLRRKSEALRHGDYRGIDGVPESIYAYQRQSGRERILVVLNFSDRTEEVSIPGTGNGAVLVGTHAGRERQIDARHLTVRPNEGFVVALE